MKKSTIIIFLFVLAFIFSFLLNTVDAICQSEDYYITNEGDTIGGEIKGWQKIYRYNKVTFKAENGEKLKFIPEDIKGFYSFREGSFYKSLFKLNLFTRYFGVGDNCFGREIITGKVTVYELIIPNNMSVPIAVIPVFAGLTLGVGFSGADILYFILEKEDKAFPLLLPGKGIVPKKDRALMADFLSDNKEIAENILLSGKDKAYRLRKDL